jgi:hypothetical protein
MATSSESYEQPKSIMIQNFSRNNIHRICTNSDIFSSFGNKTNKNKKKLYLPLIKESKDFVIEWKVGQKEIYLTGIFGQFSKKSKVSSKKENKYAKQSKLYSSKNIQKFKFKTNGNLKVNGIYLISKRPQIFEEKYKKNIPLNIDNKNLSISTKDSSLTSINKTFFTKKSEKLDKIKIETKNNDIDFAYSKKNYCNYYPTKSELKKMVDQKPSFMPTYTYQGLNHSHNKLGKEEYLNMKEDIFCSNNDAYKSIERKDHILLNHLCQKVKNGNLINSFTIRYRHKNATFVYYK